MRAGAPATAPPPVVAVAADFLELSFEERYDIVSQRFPDWLLAEPIEFPPHHPTFGWACQVDGCDRALAPTTTRMLCLAHTKEYNRIKDATDFEEFLAAATARRAKQVGWALVRKPSCAIAGCPREFTRLTYCTSHHDSFQRARQRGVSETEWAATQQRYEPWGACAIGECVHDGEKSVTLDGDRRRLCVSHHMRIWTRLKNPSTQSD
ncbi:hypothetical protein ACTD5D_22930 [Nocardia takedensis]|uniref:hypothetical protein n=1 Tax=Nocardia takedensis TaxID=259390 RepID=UPI003F771EF5